MRISSLATLRSNAQILEMMAAQLEMLLDRTEDQDERWQLRTMAARTRLLCREYIEAAQDVATDLQPMTRSAGAS
jgi:hypothetical protein